MTEKDFIFQTPPREVNTGSATWQAPSNIALVKYWGKKENQIPANPSISFTLNSSRTTTTLQYILNKKSTGVAFELFFEGRKKDDFKPKIANFFQKIEKYCPYILNYSFTIHTENTFPHSSGIASSASGMGALALCVMSLEKELNPDISEDHFYKKASFLARLGSGSACRSIEGPVVIWGENKVFSDSSDLYGVKFDDAIHPVFKNYQDTILLVDKGKKQVSSSLGHNLMHGHPFAEQRFSQANSNLQKIKEVLILGDLDTFIKIVESEALTLHAMMMSSNPYFILMKPNTLEIINKVWEYRDIQKIPLCFTLDAGANVHLLYPEQNKDAVLEFIKYELVAYCENEQYLCDAIGNGAKKL